ncbi:DUF2812 domain-containing protein [Nocardiopsis sp. NPDC006139]|uniref:DUF2812 domain-containing protein n=1 Tax=unclassified Nocardiopsis TaxID=2649073 RepID=UPI0033BE02E9
MTYFDELAERLAARGVDAERSRVLLEELSAYAADAGVDPEEEFGPVDGFADSLAPREEGGRPEELAWTADAFETPARLNGFGAQGWEVERIDRLGRFVGRRDRENPQTWEYRQEVCTGRADRERLAARLAPDGWEPCGHWSVLAYFKRPGAATAGPGAELEDPPAPGPRRAFFGARGIALIAASLAVVAVSVWSIVQRAADGRLTAEGPEELAGLAAGALVGAALVLGAVWAVLRIARSVRDRR